MLLSFRQMKLISVDCEEALPFGMSEQFQKLNLWIAEKLEYQYTAIDWMKDKDTDEMYFLEANFACMFANYEQMSGNPITQSFVKLLTE